jgi:hypothetical protein
METNRLDHGMALINLTKQHIDIKINVYIRLIDEGAKR